MQKTQLIIEDFQHVYQPIYNLSDFTIWGYEAFLRPVGYKGSIETFFLLAKENKRLYELDSKSIEESITNFYQRSDVTTKLFVNVFTSSILETSFEVLIINLINKLKIPASRIILEINESEEIINTKLLQIKLKKLNDIGVKIAIDDFGKGSATIKNVIELIPDYIKLDKYFADNLSAVEKKQKMVRTLVNHFKDDTKLILEGIEREEDLAMAKVLGVPLGQGFLLGVPEYIGSRNNL